MFAKLITTTLVLGTTAFAAGCHGDGPSKAQVDGGIDNAFQAPGKIAGAAGEAGGNLAATAVETPGNAVEDGSEKFNDDN